MKSTLLLLLAPLAALAAPAPELTERQAADSINKLIQAKGKKYYGSCADQSRLSSGKSAAVIQADFGQVTPENSMKVG
jgi:endo-1,4-beta-xylanase